MGIRVATFRPSRRFVLITFGAGCLSMAAIGAAGVLCLIFLLVRGGETAPDRRIAITREWARLAPLPASARNLRTSAHGGSFTRAFRISFSAPAADIERWLKESPGVREARVDRPSSGVRHFSITPGGGAQHAEVTVDDTTGEVRIYAYWS